MCREDARGIIRGQGGSLLFQSWKNPSSSLGLSFSICKNQVIRTNHPRTLPFMTIKRYPWVEFSTNLFLNFLTSENGFIANSTYSIAFLRKLKNKCKFLRSVPGPKSTLPSQEPQSLPVPLHPPSTELGLVEGSVQVSAVLAL